MKIGILTHPLDSNYGCLLQAFALQKTLISMGHDVVTIDRRNTDERSVVIKLKSWILRIYLRFFLKKEVSVFWSQDPTKKVQDLLSSKTKLFVNRNIINTGIVTSNELKEIDTRYKFDAYVVGSDQVWLPHFCPNSFLDFVKREGVVKIFYAASSGKKCFMNYPKLVKQCVSLSESFKGISVRENSLVKPSIELFKRDVYHVLDPTFLLTPEDYLNACVEKIDNSPVIFAYILDKSKEKMSMINHVKEEQHMPIVFCNPEESYLRGVTKKINNCIYPSVDHWILNLKKASFVITDSFHGTCMAILFGKPFVVIGNIERGIDRFLSVLEIFHLQNRLITEISNFSDEFYKPLDTEKINKIISERRTYSLSFIKGHLKS